MGFGEAIRTCFSKYATRSEYWYFALFAIVADLAGGIIARATGIIVISQIIAFGLLAPLLAVGVRRLHDIDRSSRWYLLGLVPWIGPIALGIADVGPTFIIIVYLLVALVVSIVLTVWACTRGTVGPNRYGPDPLADAADAVALA